MKTIAFTIVFILLSIFGFSQDIKGITLTVTVTNIKDDTGHLLMNLHSAETFMKGKGIQNAKSEIKNGKVTTIFTNVQQGTYAVMAFHDANDNNQMDFQPNGMPIEGYGMSNNPMVFGPPEFTDAKFIVADKDVSIAISL